MKYFLRILPAILMLAACRHVPPLPQDEARRSADRLIVSLWYPGSMLPAPPAPNPGFVARSAETERLRQLMESRKAELKTLLDAGQIGLGRDGFLETHDTSGLDADARDRIRDLIARENADRAALFHELARINSQPSWLSPIAVVYAQRYIEQAPPGWWYRDADNRWQQKAPALAVPPPAAPAEALPAAEPAAGGTP
ncbi:Uncharacterized conserved protein YdbL, DUF1318 family [Solimonas aquatica]|uniref:Uncharacterized conserved protein YdbL, DUF1318 family n=1 Tax=Solimonas aquatica TaxID=489703 RepID=A0A1H9MFI6_9GAMM|nr:YdbL family protein [Solimonas aquatica]SER22205.1 Uncharacterized conserved protein YdbL, DUF1318 family [Solimonas aquatica]